MGNATTQPPAKRVPHPPALLLWEKDARFCYFYVSELYKLVFITQNYSKYTRFTFFLKSGQGEVTLRKSRQRMNSQVENYIL
ncbi:MAG TPA: hypothetical protein DCL86_01215 [Bacteroidales bacterium]|nr:hypothetical protein [Bacteroidales bacterium]